jgi:hypothetical protein
MMWVWKVVKMLPFIVRAVRAAEKEIPLPKSGKEKLDRVLDSVEKVYGTAENITPVVNATVRVFNATGVFKRSKGNDRT